MGALMEEEAKMMRRTLLILLALAAFPAAAAAQTCVGNAPLRFPSGWNSVLTGGAGFFDGGTSYDTGLTVGQRRLLSIGFGYTDLDGTDLSLKTVYAAGAAQMNLARSPVMMCPSVTVGYGFGLESFGADVNTWTVTPALSLGLPIDVASDIAVVPFGRIGLVWRHITADAGALGGESNSDTSGVLGFGFSMLFNDMFSVGPTVTIPFATDGSDDAMFGISASLGVGR